MAIAPIKATPQPSPRDPLVPKGLKALKPKDIADRAEKITSQLGTVRSIVDAFARDSAAALDKARAAVKDLPLSDGDRVRIAQAQADGVINPMRAQASTRLTELLKSAGAIHAEVQAQKDHFLGSRVAHFMRSTLDSERVARLTSMLAGSGEQELLHTLKTALGAGDRELASAVVRANDRRGNARSKEYNAASVAAEISMPDYDELEAAYSTAARDFQALVLAQRAVTSPLSATTQAGQKIREGLLQRANPQLADADDVGTGDD